MYMAQLIVHVAIFLFLIYIIKYALNTLNEPTSWAQPHKEIMSSATHR